MLETACQGLTSAVRVFRAGSFSGVRALRQAQLLGTAPSRRAAQAFGQPSGPSLAAPLAPRALLSRVVCSAATMEATKATDNPLLTVGGALFLPDQLPNQRTARLLEVVGLHSARGGPAAAVCLIYTRPAVVKPSSQCAGPQLGPLRPSPFVRSLPLPLRCRHCQPPSLHCRAPSPTHPRPAAQDSPLPRYDEVAAEHVVPGIRALLAELHAEIDALERSVQPTWEGLVEPVERVVDRISRAWGTVSHLKAVKDSEELRKAVEEVQPEKVKLTLRLSQVGGVYWRWWMFCVFVAQVW